MTASLPDLTGRLRPVVEAAGCDLESLSVMAAGRRTVVRVLVDKDGGVTLDDVAEVSRALGDALDAADDAGPGPFAAAYVLEVSSPGVDRPLTEPRHWRRNTGRLVTATLRDAASLTGRVVAADGTGITLEVDGAQQELAYSDVVSGVVQVEFSRPASPGEKA